MKRPLLSALVAHAQVRQALPEGLSWQALALWLALQALRYLIVIVPLVISVLLAIAVRVNAGVNWLALRASAESLKAEVYHYRAAVKNACRLPDTTDERPETPQSDRQRSCEASDSVIAPPSGSAPCAAPDATVAPRERAPIR